MMEQQEQTGLDVDEIARVLGSYQLQLMQAGKRITQLEEQLKEKEADG